VVGYTHLAGLGRPASVSVHPAELERLGVVPGGTVRITSSRGSVTLPASADAHLPKGSASLTFNVTTPGAADLIDASAPVTEVRLEGA
jgi:NADH-quinone oxidoreductase subunit G